MRDTTMKPAHSILDRTFRYVPAVATSVAETWRRFGWRPMTAEQRNERLRRATAFLVEGEAAITPIERAAPAAAAGRRAAG